MKLCRMVEKANDFFSSGRIRDRYPKDLRKNRPDWVGEEKEVRRWELKAEDMVLVVQRQ